MRLLVTAQWARRYLVPRNDKSTRERTSGFRACCYFAAAFTLTVPKWAEWQTRQTAQPWDDTTAVFFRRPKKSLKTGRRARARVYVCVWPPRQWVTRARVSTSSGIGSSQAQGARDVVDRWSSSRGAATLPFPHGDGYVDGESTCSRISRTRSRRRSAAMCLQSFETRKVSGISTDINHRYVSASTASKLYDSTFLSRLLSDVFIERFLGCIDLWGLLFIVLSRLARPAVSAVPRFHWMSRERTITYLLPLLFE